jgi:hypothetical protein
MICSVCDICIVILPSDVDVGVCCSAATASGFSNGGGACCANAGDVPATINDVATTIKIRNLFIFFIPIDINLYGVFQFSVLGLLIHFLFSGVWNATIL